MKTMNIKSCLFVTKSWARWPTLGTNPTVGTLEKTNGKLNHIFGFNLQLSEPIPDACPKTNHVSNGWTDNNARMSLVKSQKDYRILDLNLYVFFSFSLMRYFNFFILYSSLFLHKIRPHSFALPSDIIID